MEKTGYPKMLISTYKMVRHDQDDHCCENIKPHADRQFAYSPSIDQETI